VTPCCCACLWCLQGVHHNSRCLARVAGHGCSLPVRNGKRHSSQWKAVLLGDCGGQPCQS
jgi:hypothetical protein